MRASRVVVCTLATLGSMIPGVLLYLELASWLDVASSVSLQCVESPAFCWESLPDEKEWVVGPCELSPDPSYGDLYLTYANGDQLTTQDFVEPIPWGAYLAESKEEEVVEFVDFEDAPMGVYLGRVFVPSCESVVISIWGANARRRAAGQEFALRLEGEYEDDIIEGVELGRIVASVLLCTFFVAWGVFGVVMFVLGATGRQRGEESPQERAS